MSIEDIRAGDVVLSRDEYDPHGAAVGKVVEEVFVRLAPVWELLVGGRVIGTTQEHPFYAWEKECVPARELAAGDTLLCEDGVWRCVDGVRGEGKSVRVGFALSDQPSLSASADRGQPVYTPIGVTPQSPRAFWIQAVGDEGWAVSPKVS